MNIFKNTRHLMVVILLGIALLTYCTVSRKVTNPIVTLPENADPESPYWKGIDLEPKDPVLPLPVAKQKAKFLLYPGYEMEAVLTDPNIQQPAAINFDGNGRMYVLELRSYMLTADSEGTLEPVSAISRWEDLNNDGVYETGGIFVDSLVFPRFVLPYGPNSVLTMESNADNVYKFTDTDLDGKADKKEFFTNNFGRPGNVEHQQAFLYWGMDNWLYSTVNPFRVRETENGVIRESTGSNHAQWGITHDDDGKLWFQGGANGLPSYFQFPIHYGDYVVDNNFAEGFDIPWGAPIGIADMQGGMGAVRMPEGTLNRVTGASGNDIFRGNRLPEDLRGQYFYGEPVARIVRQVDAKVVEGLTTLYQVYQDEKSEFIRSTDPLFRPVDMATAPDGTMYIVDMYHGIIQEGQWTPVGSYLRVKIEQYQLDKVVSLGRIWRLTHQEFERDETRPQMYEESSLSLLQHLEHPNGWWRDMAQQILVQRKDKSVTSRLIDLVRNNSSLLTRFHALWVLEGIGELESTLVKEMLTDSNPRMRKMALWVSESLYKAGDKSFEKFYVDMFRDPDLEVRMRAMMTARLFKISGREEAVKELMAADSSKGIQLVGKQVLDPPQVTSFFGRSNPDLSEKEQALVNAGEEIYQFFCATCHGALGNGTAVGDNQLMGPSFINSPKIQGHPVYMIKTLLHGLSGEIDGRLYTGSIMAPMGFNSDEWIAAVSSFVRTNFENESPVILPEYVAEIRKQTSGQKGIYEYKDLWASIPKVIAWQPEWEITASHSAPIRKGSSGSPAAAFSFEGWTTGISQQKGMWFKVEFPEKITISELHFNSPPISRGWRDGAPPPIQTYPRGFRLEVSLDDVQWEETVGNGKLEGDNSDVIIKFDPIDARFLRIKLTETIPAIHGERWGQPFDYEVAWTMQQFKIYGFP